MPLSLGPVDLGRPLFSPFKSFDTLVVLLPIALRPPLNLNGSFSFALIRLAANPTGLVEGGGFCRELAAPPIKEGAFRFV